MSDEHANLPEPEPEPEPVSTEKLLAQRARQLRALLSDDGPVPCLCGRCKATDA